MSNEQEEVQKALAEMNQRVADFQDGQKDFSTDSPSPEIKAKLKLYIVLAGVVLALIIASMFYIKSTGPKMKEPPASAKSMAIPFK